MSYGFKMRRLPSSWFGLAQGTLTHKTYTVFSCLHSGSPAEKSTRALQGHKPNDADARDEQELFGAVGGGNALGDEFGLQLQDDDEEGGGGFDDDDDDDDMDAEEGEV